MNAVLLTLLFFFIIKPALSTCFIFRFDCTYIYMYAVVVDGTKLVINSRLVFYRSIPTKKKWSLHY